MSNNPDPIQAAVEDTETEIFNFAADVEDPEPDSEPEPSGDPEADDPQFPEMVEGWNGAVPNAELQHTARYGNDLPGGDRPLQHAEITDQLQAASQRIQQLEADNAQLHQVKDPQMREDELAQQQQRDDWLLSQSIENPKGLWNLINGLDAQRTEAQTKHVEASLAAAHKKYGDEFERPYNALKSQSHGDPLAREIVRKIWHDPNPGEALVRLGGRQIPIMGGTRPVDRSLEGSSNNSDMGRDSDIWRYATQE